MSRHLDNATTRLPDDPSPEEAPDAGGGGVRGGAVWKKGARIPLRPFVRESSRAEERGGTSPMSRLQSSLGMETQSLGATQRQRFRLRGGVEQGRTHGMNGTSRSPRLKAAECVKR